MNHHRKRAILAGALIIAGMAAGALSIVAVVEQPDYLTEAAAHSEQVYMGAFFQFLMIPAYVGFALCLYPILKTQHEGSALGFVGFRMMVGMFHWLGVIILPLFITLSQSFLDAGTPEASHFHTLGAMLRTSRDLVNHVAMILALSLGDLLLFYMLYERRLIPRWLSTWGVIGTGLTMAASLLVLFRLTEVITPLYMGLNMPVALQSATLALWLIARGFDNDVAPAPSFTVIPPMARSEAL